jgi:hypothetical protein
VRSLRSLYPDLRTVPFLLYHAEELRTRGPVSDEPDVHVRSLKGWYDATFAAVSARERGDGPVVDDLEGLRRFRSFLCKPAALLAAPADLVAVLDLDAMPLHSPFALLNTTVFEETGSYLFLDRKVVADQLPAYVEALEETWRVSDQVPCRACGWLSVQT